GMVKNINNKISKFLMYPRQYSRRARIAQSSALPIVADEPASPVREVSEGEAGPTEFGFIADQDRATIAKQYSKLQAKFQAQKKEIVKLKERVKVLEDREDVAATQSRDDALIKGRSINEGEVAAERISNDLEEIARVLTSMDAATGMRMNEQIARDTEVARIHAEEELQEEAPENETSTEEFTEEKMKEMMQLVPIEDVYVQALQVKHPIIDWKVHTEGQRSYWQIIRLGGSSACYQFFVDLLKQLDRRSNRRRVPNIVELEIRTIEEVVLMADRTMEELLHAPTEGYGEAIIIPKILAENFEIKTNLLQLVQTNKFHGFERDNPHTHISNFKRMTSTLKYKDVPNDAIKLMLFSYSLEGAARIWYEKEPPNSILSWDDLVNKFVNQFFPPSKTTHLKNEISRFTQRFEDTFGEAWERFNGLNEQDQDTLNAAAGGNLLTPTSGTLPSNIVPNPKGEMKAVTTRSGLAYEGSSIPTNSPFEKVVEQDTEESMDKEHSNCQGSTAHIQPLVVSISKLDVSKTQPKPNIPYPSRLNDQKLREKATNQMEKFFQIFHDFHFDISFADALLLMLKFASTIKSLLTNKDKLFKLAKVSLNENCSAMLFKKPPEKLGDPDKFLIPCDFPGIDVCHALADLGASINLMPLSIWKKLSLIKLTPTWMTLELSNRSITRPKGVAEDVFVKVGKFYFPTDFMVADFEADPRVPLILWRSFLRTDRALIDVYGEEITLRLNDESVTFNLNQTMRYSSTYDDNSVNQVDVIDIACEEFVQDVLDFQYNSKSSNPILVSNPLFSKKTESESCKQPTVKSSSPILTLFGESDFFLEEIEDFLNDELIPTGIENSLYDPEGGILYLEKLLNEDPFQLPPMNLKQAEETKAKSSIEEPAALELKELLIHVEKEALIKVLKSYKRAISWKISDIKGFDPRFCTHKILMKEDYKLAVQSQRWVNMKIHDVIKKEVIKLFDAGMIYPISDSPWVSLIHCVPKKGGMTVVANKNNELVLTRLVTGWRVCIDYRKLNDATRKGHFPLPFMDQMLERLVGNEFYCFLEEFSGYFQIPIDPQDQEKTTFTCPYGTFAYRRMPFGLCNAPGHKISKSRIEVDREKVDVIAKLSHPTTVKGVRSFLGHAGFYRRFIQDFSKIARHMTHLLEKETPFVFSKDCIDAF
nr:reverse transcriptase domain-containing protein [Tanacetum cinerariifolium]